ncbi:hypothetical protein AB0F93_24580, partial [Micromonospora tulbaghiae]
MPESSSVTSGTGVVPDDSEAGSDAPATRSGDGAGGSAGAAAAGPAVVDRETLRLALVVGGLVLAVLLGFGLGRMNAPADPARPGSATAGVFSGAASEAARRLIQQAADRS